MTMKTYRNACFFALIMAVALIPDAKALVLRGLMGIGFFSPSISRMPQHNRAVLRDIKLRDRNGHILNLEQLEGKVIFINIWATWCPPCVAELPTIHNLYQRYQQDINVAFLMVDADGNLQQSSKMFVKRGYQMPLYSLYSRLPESLMDGSIPTTLVFDKQGRLSYRHTGAANYNSAQFIKFIEQLKRQQN